MTHGRKGSFMMEWEKATGILDKINKATPRQVFSTFKIKY